METEKPFPVCSWTQAYYTARQRARTQPNLTETSWQYFEVKGEYAYITGTGGFRPLNESENEMLKQIYDELDKEELSLAGQVEELQLSLNRERKLRKRYAELLTEAGVDYTNVKID